MSQINKYADKAAYEADAARLKTLSSESYIENDGVLLYDGVNTVIRKSAAGVGDLVVFDKTDSTLKFIKGDTLVTEKIPPQLIPAGVVYGRHGDKVRIVSLDNASFKGSTAVRWSYSYEVALSGFNLTTDGTAVLTFGTGIYKIDMTLTWSAGAELSDINAQINSFVTGQIKGYGWSSSIDEANSRIIMSSNTWSNVYEVIEVVSGCQITRPPEDVNYQTTLTGVLIEGSTEYVRTATGQQRDYPRKCLYGRSQSGIGHRLSDLPGLSVRRTFAAIPRSLWCAAARRQDQHAPDRAAYLRGYLW